MITSELNEFDAKGGLNQKTNTNSQKRTIERTKTTASKERLKLMLNVFAKTLAQSKEHRKIETQ